MINKVSRRISEIVSSQSRLEKYKSIQFNTSKRSIQRKLNTQQIQQQHSPVLNSPKYVHSKALSPKNVSNTKVNASYSVTKINEQLTRDKVIELINLIFNQLENRLNDRMARIERQVQRLLQTKFKSMENSIDINSRVEPNEEINVLISKAQLIAEQMQSNQSIIIHKIKQIDNRVEQIHKKCIQKYQNCQQQFEKIYESLSKKQRKPSFNLQNLQKYRDMQFT